MVSASLPVRLRRICGNAGRFLLDSVLPPLCLGCNEIVATPGALCVACWQGFSFITAPQCGRCGSPFSEQVGAGAVCATCLAHPPLYRRARAALVYDAQCRKLVLPFKHGDRTDIARACGGWMARAGAELLASADLIAPVPLHWRRLVSRRYNQAALLARAVEREALRQNGREFRLVPDLLHRARWTGSQAGLRAMERRSNVRRAFVVSPQWSARVAGRQILLVDDVLTTGATVEACARVLERAGARSIDVLTLARVVRPAV